MEREVPLIGSHWRAVKVLNAALGIFTLQVCASERTATHGW